MSVVKFEIGNGFTPEELVEARARIEMFFVLERGALADDAKLRLGPPLLFKVQDATMNLDQVEIIGTARQQVVMDIARLYRMVASQYGEGDGEEA